MDRREAVKYISLLMGGTLVGGTALLTGCKSETGKPLDWSADDIAYLNEIGETILPATATPGAKAANVGQFMTVMVNDCYERDDQKAFRDGMGLLDDASKKKFDKKFMSITPQQRHELLVGLDKEAKAHQEEINKFNKVQSQKEKEEQAKGNKEYKKERMTPHYFSMMKQLTLLGFFTSEVGATQALRHVPVPGRFEGCIPYKKGDKAFA